MAGPSARGWYEHAQELKRVRDRAAKENPEASASTPSMDRLIEWADAHDDRMAVAGTVKRKRTQVRKDSAVALEALGIDVEAAPPKA